MTKDISRIDKNLEVAKTIDASDCVFHDARQAPFKCYGMYNPQSENAFCRLPKDVAEATSESVLGLYDHTAGGRVRFATDSEYIAIRCAMPSATHSSHMPLTGRLGFDMYMSVNGTDTYVKTFVPPNDLIDGYVSIHHFETCEMREITINFPLCSTVEDLYIGLEKSAEVKERSEYKYRTPVVYYGSSITQGGCASRPGNTYPALISQKLDCDYINLGFSGSARGEDAMMEYIASLDMSVFVYDYDYNAPTPEDLERTHERGFKKVREKHPELPVIFVSAPTHEYYPLRPEFIKRREIILKTYNNALAAGDKNVYFIDGAKLFDGEFSSSCTVDGCHPTDLGFYRMATVIGKCVNEVIG